MSTESTDTPQFDAPTNSGLSVASPPPPPPPRRPSPRALAIAAGAVTLAVILIATTVFALRGASRSTTANTTTPIATTAPTATAVPTATATAVPAAPLNVYAVATNSSFTESRVVALNPTDGSVRWQSAPISGSAGEPVLANEIVYVLQSSAPLIALRASDGTELWRTSAHYGFSTAPVVDGGVVYVGSGADFAHHGVVDAYHASDGKLLWEHDFGSCGASALAAANGTVIVAPSGCPTMQQTALRASDGAALWQHPVTNAGGGVTTADGVAYFDDYGDVTAYALADGMQLWHYRPQQLFSQGDSDIIAGGKLVFAGTGVGIVALHLSDGSRAWGYATTYFTTGQAYANGVVYVTGQGTARQPATLAALQATDGKQIWSIGFDLPSVWPPVSANGAVYVSDDDFGPGNQNPRPGLVYAIRATDGSVLWRHERPDGVVTMPAAG